MNKFVIDVQDRYYYDMYHYPGAINIPYDELMNNYRTYLSKNNIYYFYCKSGTLSKRAATILSYLGYNAFVIEK